MITIETSVTISGSELVSKFDDDPEEFGYFLEALTDSVPTKLTLDAAEHWNAGQAGEIVKCLRSMADDIEETFEIVPAS